MEHRIIHICGTMGSGKTTAVRGLMAARGCPWVAVMRGGRRLPLGHTSGQVFVLGAYDAGLQTSGGDTIKSAEEAYGVVLDQWRTGLHVVYEGLFMMNHTRGIALWRETRALHVLRLGTSLEDCAAGVRARRAAQGNHAPLPARFRDGLAGNDTRARNYAHKLKQIGCPAELVTRDTVVGRMMELL